MRNRVSVVIRVFAMLVMALGLVTLMSSSATAQESQTVQCQTIIDDEINQEDCVVTVTGDGQCQVVVPSTGEIFQNVGCSPEGCPQQVIDAEGNIYQFQCEAVQPTATPVTPTATPVTPTATPVTPTATPVTPGVTHTPTPVTPGVTHTPTPVTPGVVPTQTPVTPTGGQANPDDKDLEVSVLPSTGQGPDSGQSNTAPMLLLGAMGAVLTLGAAAVRLRNNS